LCYDAAKVEPVPTDESRARFKDGGAGGVPAYKRIPDPQDRHRGSTESAGYLYPRATGRDGRTTVGIVNRKIGVGVAIRYSTKEFPRCLNWQHWGPGEYVTALEPANGTVRGRAKDREDGTLDFIGPGARKTYRYTIEALADRRTLDELRDLNRRD
jgi:hypothetical protein